MCKQPLYRDTMLPSLIPTLHCRPPHTHKQSIPREARSICHLCVIDLSVYLPSLYLKQGLSSPG